ncbi:hypothetical protein B0T21DRAFT_400906 [Apiosordaria backusii]|uniref:Dihydroorotate dehydrogenase (fumarate) n=1 Tax=Apiosordaria backusii TaxID=314023 RepID=A0AA40EH41_9PEZI|nr:hypothetical protein B0T21DRAFT_400906 [Apiosordaria backusii]
MLAAGGVAWLSYLQNRSTNDRLLNRNYLNTHHSLLNPPQKPPPQVEIDHTKPSTMSEPPPPIEIHPPLINSSNPWATDLEDLARLYRCESIGAITTRTSTLRPFKHDDAIHRYVFFNPSNHQASDSTNPAVEEASRRPHQRASLNSLGYSPEPLSTYLAWIRHISTNPHSPSRTRKPFIVSVTGTPEDVAQCYRVISLSTVGGIINNLYMEINLSCPNIPDKQPPAYSKVALVEYLNALRQELEERPEFPRIPFGLKTPPYTHSSEYHELISALEEAGDQVSFITCTNTLGSCLILDLEGKNILPGNGIGGMAGAALHPLALGNVATIRRMLDEREKLSHITVIGIGGVEDEKGYRRMRAAGAGVVGVGTALGVKGVGVFKGIEEGLKGEW